LINRNGQWTLQHLNVTLPEKVFTSSKPKRAIEIKAMSFNIRNGLIFNENFYKLESK